jgi:Superinfection immunity protein
MPNVAVWKRTTPSMKTTHKISNRVLTTTAKVLMVTAVAGVLGLILIYARMHQPMTTYADTTVTVNSVVSGIVGMIVFFVVVGLLFAVYVTPSIIAARRKKANLVAIVVLNLVAGWTFIGWVVALVWALTNDASAKA